jgi:hypothetical protein
MTMIAIDSPLRDFCPFLFFTLAPLSAPGAFTASPKLNTAKMSSFRPQPFFFNNNCSDSARLSLQVPYDITCCL